MKNKVLIGALAVLLFSAFSGTGAQAATKATAGGFCTKAASTTMITGKSYTCTKALSGKLIWVLTTGAKPQISGGARGGDGGPGGPGDGHRFNGAAGQAAFKAYNACLTSHGGTALTLPQGFHPGGGPDDGGRPTTPPVQPSVSATQQKAMTACASLAPKFGPGFDH